MFSDAGSTSNGLRFDSHEVENAQILSQTVNLNTQIESTNNLLPLKLSMNVNDGERAFSVPHKEAYEVNPTTLPSTMSREIETEATASPQVSFQKDTLAEKV